MLNKIHKPNLAGRPSVFGKGGPTKHISSFIDSPLQPIAKNQESYIKDTTDFKSKSNPDSLVIVESALSSPASSQALHFLKQT